MTDPLRAPSAATAAINQRAADELPFDQDPQQEAVLRGFLTAPSPVRIERPDGGVAWSLEPYEFLAGPRPDEVHPSLWRISQLNRQNAGLFEVCEGVYQVRGFDISNMSILRTDSGYLVVDPLTTVASARAAMRLVYAELGELPLTGIIYTHSHSDHFGGVRGVLEVCGVDDPTSIPIIAPDGFMDETVSENVYAGNAMLRRAMFMFGPMLPRGPRGQVSAGLGMTVAAGVTSLVPPSVIIDASGQSLTVDGLEIIFQYTPDTEAPAELIFHLPSRRALCMAEIVNHVMHNLYTLRGAQVRDSLGWAKCLYEAVNRFGADTDVMFISHHWPVWGKDEVAQFITTQADMYKYLHDETLRLANHGHGPEEIAERVELPQSLAHFWPNRGLYGSVSHNTRAIYQRYLGFFDGNPASLHRHAPTPLGERYVKALGGPDAVLAIAQAAYDEADYRWAAELLRHVLAARPDFPGAAELQAATFDQLGYQSEAGSWRNTYLWAAQELRSGVPAARPAPKALNEVRAAMTVEMTLDYLAIRLNGPRAEGRSVELTLHVMDEDRDFAVILRNCVLSFVPGRTTGAPSLALTRLALLRIADGINTLAEEVDRGEASDDGGGAALAQILGLLDRFDPRFPIVTDRSTLHP